MVRVRIGQAFTENNTERSEEMLHFSLCVGPRAEKTLEGGTQLPNGTGSVWLGGRVRPSIIWHRTFPKAGWG